MELRSERFRLRPLALADTETIARIIFADPVVTGFLAHDVRTDGDALREAARWTQIMGIDGDGGIWDDGGIGLFAISPQETPTETIGVAGYYMARDDDGAWSGEYFYALGRDWHFKGIMSELSPVFRHTLHKLPDVNLIYGVYWDGVNAASGRILEKSGLAPAGRVAVLDEYPTEKCRAIFDYDMWRTVQAQNTPDFEIILSQSCRRAGAFVVEGIVSNPEARSALTDSAGGRLPDAAQALLDFGITNPGMAHVEYRGPAYKNSGATKLG